MSQRGSGGELKKSKHAGSPATLRRAWCISDLTPGFSERKEAIGFPCSRSLLRVLAGWLLRGNRSYAVWEWQCVKFMLRFAAGLRAQTPPTQIPFFD